ncbi:MAG: hypothetical protein V3V41_07585 [Candidatus Heimdallarchaeota archaeon]
MNSSNDRKYVKYELNFKQKSKIADLASKKNVDADSIMSRIEDFLDCFTDYDNFTFWDKLLSFFNMKMIDFRSKIIADDIIETKKKIKEQKKLLREYEDDYLAIVALGKTLESLNKI